jgi:Family of unknown function (DUF6152)
MRYMSLSACALLGCLISQAALAHHSFAVHFDGDKLVTISGTVTEFRFRNPHGLIFVAVKDSDGEVASWRAETNSPNVLRRRGWSSESIKPGDEVELVGFPSRDGSNSMRIYRVTFADGHELVGQRPAPGVED